MTVAVDLREEARERFEQLGWPTPRLEEWKYTNLGAIAKTEWREGPASEAHASTQATHDEHAAVTFVFSNGHLVRKSGNPVGVRELDDANGELSFDDNALVALNAAYTHGGVHIEVDGVIDGFIHLVFRGEGDNVWSHPRNIIRVARNAQVAIVETYEGSGAYFTNAVTEIVAEENAVVEHTTIVCESHDAAHVGTLSIRQERSSQVTAHNITAGGKLVRNDVTVRLNGEGANVVLDGLFAVTGNQHVDNHTLIDHVTPHCESLELYKGVLDQSARGVFDGSIIVREGAQKTVSRQTNHNLLLSETAVVDSKPTLVIHNDDVKCNHGSTIGQLDEQALFYLRSRGISAEEARNLLVLAFASELVDRLKIEAVREQVRRALFQQMPGRLPERREKTR